MYFQTNEVTCEEVKKVLQAQPDKPQNIRVFIAGMGWGGPSFGLGLDQVKEEDIQEEIGGINFVMEKSVFDSVGEVGIFFANGGYRVAPMQEAGESACGSCAGSCG